MVLDDNNLLKGAFDQPGLKRNREQLEKSSRRLSIISIVLGIVWLLGFASLFGLLLGIMARVDAEAPKTRRLAHIAIAINGLGLLVSLVFVAVRLT